MSRALAQAALLRLVPPLNNESETLANPLASAIRETLRLESVGVEARDWLATAGQSGFMTDWADSPKAVDFAAVAVVASKLLHVRATIETGVFRGGSSAVLIQAVGSGGFHLTVDPFGLRGQSYHHPDYGDWHAARQTISRLAAFAADREVNHLHYWMGSVTFARADLLRIPAPVAIVHLDGDHSYRTVRTELRYFLKRVRPPALYILDDHDEHFPGVEIALRLHGRALLPVLHEQYPVPGYGNAGFSVWLHV